VRFERRFWMVSEDWSRRTARWAITPGTPS